MQLYFLLVFEPTEVNVIMIASLQEILEVHIVELKEGKTTAANSWLFLF